MADPVSIELALKGIADFILRYAVTLAALGALTVALLEAYKKLFSTLARFHQKSVQRWLGQEKPVMPKGFQLLTTLTPGGHYGVALGANARPLEASVPYSAEHAYAELLHLTTGVSPGRGAADSFRAPNGAFVRNVSLALFELELATMMSQIQEAADAALNNPAHCPYLFAFLTRGCNETDVRDWSEAMTSARPLHAPDEAVASLRRAELAEVYARIRLLMRRQLDSFQTVTSYRWREWNQFWAWVVGAVLLFVAQVLEIRQDEISVSGYVVMIVTSLAGGMLAPVAKDLMDALNKVKSGG